MSENKVIFSYKDIEKKVKFPDTFDELINAFLREFNENKKKILNLFI